jgi:argininosuccinate lyase
MVLSLEGSVAARRHIGGTAPLEVKARVGEAQKMLSERRNNK